jgi:uncharacterized RDD family membrane protein YckC
MKCKKCGYVSFDEEPECKQCGEVRKEEDNGVNGEARELGNDLFSLRLEYDEEERLGSEQTETDSEDSGDLRLAEEKAPSAGNDEDFELPEMRIDYDPDADTGVSGIPEAPNPVSADADDREARAIIHDDTELPDTLWLEESAGFAPRLGACAVDLAILAALLSLFGIGAYLALGPGEYSLAVFGTPGVFIAFYLLGLLLSLGYFTFFFGWAGRTPGKALLNLDVRCSDGAPMTYPRGFLRWAGYLVSLTFFGLGFLWILFDERKKGWHDYLSGTWVKDLRHES